MLVKKQRIILFCFLLFAVVIIFHIGCQKETPKIDTKNILHGAITEQKLLDLSPAYSAGKKAYQPDSAAVTFLHEIKAEVHIIVFLGTWCSDSQRELPRFLKVMEAVDNVFFTSQMIGVDRSKQEPEGLADLYQIEFVPTFVVMRNGHELGRIVETPILSIEQDLQEILSVFF